VIAEPTVFHLIQIQQLNQHSIIHSFQNQSYLPIIRQ